MRNIVEENKQISNHNNLPDLDEKSHDKDFSGWLLNGMDANLEIDDNIYDDKVEDSIEGVETNLQKCTIVDAEVASDDE